MRQLKIVRNIVGYIRLEVIDLVCVVYERQWSVAQVGRGWRGIHGDGACQQVNQRNVPRHVLVASSLQGHENPVRGALSNATSFLRRHNSCRQFLVCLPHFFFCLFSLDSTTQDHVGAGVRLWKVDWLLRETYRPMAIKKLGFNDPAVKHLVEWIILPVRIPYGSTYSYNS